MNLVSFAKAYVLNKRLRDDLKAIKIAGKGYSFYAYDLCTDAGIIKELSIKPKNVSELSKKLKLKNTPQLTALLDFLVGKKALKYSNNKYSLTGVVPKGFSAEEDEFVEEKYPGSSEWSLLFYKHALESLKQGSRHEHLGFDDKKASELWDEVMLGPLRSFRHLAVKELLKDSDKISSIVDYGCGAGTSIVEILEEAKTPIRLIGVDNSVKMLELARERVKMINVKNKYVELKKRDLSKPFTFKPKFDRAFCSILMNHIPQKKRADFYKLVSSNLNENGKFVIFQLVNKNKFERVFSDWLLFVIPSHQGFPFLEDHVADIKKSFSKVEVHLGGLIVVAYK